MKTITVIVPPISDYPKLGDSHEIFRQKADVAWRDLAGMVPPLNEFRGQANALAADVNTLHAEAKTYRDDTMNRAASAASDRARAENAAERAEAVVIPTEVTYSFDALETVLNGLLTRIVAQQAQISILQGA